jgi:hypothetical protein
VGFAGAQRGAQRVTFGRGGRAVLIEPAVPRLGALARLACGCAERRSRLGVECDNHTVGIDQQQPAIERIG